MELIARYQNPGYEAVADGIMDFFDRRQDLQRPGIAFGSGGSDAEPAKVSTDISLVALSRSTIMSDRRGARATRYGVREPSPWTAPPLPRAG